MKEIYAWVPWFVELCEKIEENGKEYLIGNSKEVQWNEMSEESQLSGYEDDLIDPLSFLYILASKYTKKNRPIVGRSIEKVFQLNKKIPEEQLDVQYFPMPAGVNVLFHGGKDNSNPELLYKLFSDAVSGLDSISPDDFESALKIKNVGVTKLTQVMYLINPEEYFPAVSRVIDSIDWTAKHLTLDEYKSYLGGVQNEFPGCRFCEIDRLLYIQYVDKIINVNHSCYIVNAKSEDRWRDFDDNNHVYVDTAEDFQQISPDTPKRGDIVLVFSSAEKIAKGIGIIDRNDYQAQFDSNHRIHVMWMNKQSVEFHKMIETKGFSSSQENIELFKREKEFQRTFELISEMAIYAEDKKESEKISTESAEIQNENSDMQNSINAENLILYGPPGTGKTYRTAEEAVRLCGKGEFENRDQLMATYRGLLKSGQIEFVTFHQSMSYEDFVEGRQPTTESDEGNDSSTAGFRLETVHGIFRKLARRAEISRGRRTKRITIMSPDQKRNVFKITIQEELLREAIDRGYVLFGLEDIDWSDNKYTDKKQIRDTVKSKGKTQDYDNVNAKWWAVDMPNALRNRMQIGDIVIVSKGTLEFQAIGEITGDYKYETDSNEYPHRRSVRWLWSDNRGVSVSEIYSRRFSPKLISGLSESDLKISALEWYLNILPPGDKAEPEPFVLIIDEINRANISKVFGELITLLEPDKRLGKTNELKVRLPYSGDEFGVPSNLHILGTMNTADRSIALLDTALRRRFTFQEVMPDPKQLADASNACGLDLEKILTTINERIEYLYDREHQIGHAYFMNCKSTDDLDKVMRDRIIPLLSEYFFEDWSKVATVLGDAQTREGNIDGGFLNRHVLKAPPSSENGDPRYRWVVRSKEEGFNYEKLIGQ